MAVSQHYRYMYLQSASSTGWNVATAVKQVIRLKETLQYTCTCVVVKQPSTPLTIGVKSDPLSSKEVPSDSLSIKMLYSEYSLAMMGFQAY